MFARLFKKTQHGFTLIEILLVVMIIGVLAALTIPNLVGKGVKAKISASRAEIETLLGTALDIYEMDNGRYPTTEQGLKALMAKPSLLPEPKNWSGPYLKKKKQIPKDPWGNDYVYASPGIHNKDSYDLSSLGPDGVTSGDDIVNWEEADGQL